MALEPFEHLGRQGKMFPLIYRAEVIDNEDLETQGRVQVRVWPMMKGISATVLPWAAPAFSLFEGGMATAGVYTVPEVGSHIFVFFEAGDVMHPVYFASAPAKPHGPSGKAPDKKIWQSRSGHRIEVDDSSGAEKVKVTHKAGSLIELDKDGNVTVENTGSGQVKIGDGALQKLLNDAAAAVYNTHTHTVNLVAAGLASITTTGPSVSMGDPEKTDDTRAS